MTANTAPTAEALAALCGAALRGEAPAWPFGADGAAATRCIEYGGYHGIAPLLYVAMADQPAWATWHGAVREALEREYWAMAALELLREREMRELLEAFKEAGIQTLLLKGTALAYGLYDVPTLRPRTDTDLLIEPALKAKAFGLLQAQGYTAPHAISGEYVSTQRRFMKEAQGVRHAIDLHWQISNAQVFAQRFAFDELWQWALQVPRLGVAAARLSDVHALLHACLHRAVHARHGEQDRLQWFYDMHLLAGAMDRSQWDTFAELARRKAMGAICADALHSCRQRLHTPIPAEVMQALEEARGEGELSAPLLTAGGLRSAMLNLRALPTWRARAKLLREQVLPHASYMRARYGVSGVLPLTRVYIARLFKGSGKLLAGPKPGPSR